MLLLVEIDQTFVDAYGDICDGVDKAGVGRWCFFQMEYVIVVGSKESIFPW